MFVSGEMPTAVGVTSWLNAYAYRGVSRSDAVNACESWTDSLGVLESGVMTTWNHVLDVVDHSNTPCVAVLPSFGNFQGVPVELNASLDSGFIAIGPSHLLGTDSSGMWHIWAVEHAVTHPDVSHSRQEFLRTLGMVTDKLSARDFAGNRSDVESNARVTSPPNLPPTVPQRDLELLLQAWRISTIATLAITHAISYESPSTQTVKNDVLNTLVKSAHVVMCAIASHGSATLQQNFPIWSNSAELFE